VKILLFLITTNIVTIVLSIFINLAFAEQNEVIVIEKPKWCNSASISYSYRFGEFQEEYKYPCATYMEKYVTSDMFIIFI
jgi:hypothetical protein